MVHCGFDGLVVPTVHESGKRKVRVMYKIGEYVISTNNGICKVEDIMHPDFVTEKDKMYYEILPVGEVKTKLYVSVEKANDRIRKVMTEEDAWKLIDEIPTIDETWIDNDKQRENKYKEAIFSGKPEFLVSIIKTMYSRKKKRTASGKKNTLVDERYFKMAEEHLYSELAFAIGKEKEEMQELITNRINEVVQD